MERGKKKNKERNPGQRFDGAVGFVDAAHKEGKPIDSELFVCPWDARVIVKAYQNLGAKKKKDEQREGGKGGKRGAAVRKKKPPKQTLALIKLYQELPRRPRTPTSATR